LHSRTSIKVIAKACAGDDQLQFSGEADIPFFAYGDAGDDQLQGGSFADTIFGGAGDDQIQGNDGDDTLIGGSGNDDIQGGNGTDTIDQDGSNGNGATSCSFNLSPEALDAGYSVNEGTPLAIELQATDPESDPLTYVVQTQPLGGVLTGSDENRIYVANPGFYGTDSFTFIANDGVVDSNLATITIDVNDVTAPTISAVPNPAPNPAGWHGSDVTVTFDCADGWSGIQSCSNPVQLVSEGANQIVSGTALDNAGNSASASATINLDKTNPSLAISSPVDGVVVTNSGLNVIGQATDSLSPVLVTFGGAAVTLDGAGNFSYPVVLVEGLNTLTFSAADAAGNVVAETITLTLNLNQAPVAQADSVSVDEDNSVALTLMATDADGDTLNYQIQAQPQNGSLTGTVPNLIYTPNADFNGTDILGFFANDGIVDSNVATISIQINPLNDAPNANAQALFTNEDTALAVTLSGQDIDGDALSFSITTAPANGVITGTVPNISYQPNPDFNGSDQIEYTVSDALSTSVPALVEINVAAVNDLPGISSLPITSTQEGQPYSYQVVANDADGDALSFALLGPAGMTIDGNGLVTWTPFQDGVGTQAVVITVTDANGGVGNQAYQLIVAAAPNRQPAIIGMPLTRALVGQLYNYSLTARDADGDVLNFVGIELPGGMNLDSVTGELSWTPGQGDIGTHLVSLMVDDGEGGTATQNFTLQVAAVDSSEAAYVGTEFWIPRFQIPDDTRLIISSEFNTSVEIEVLAHEAQGVITVSVQAGKAETVSIPKPLLGAYDWRTPSGIRNCRFAR